MGGAFFRALVVFLCASSVWAADSFLFFSPEAISSHLKNYDEEEKELIQKDLEVVRSVVFHGVNQEQEKPVYLATAGGPGSRKTTILERFLKKNGLEKQMAYIDPDPRSLKFMVHTYWNKSLSPLVAGDDLNYLAVVKNAYEKWRGGSNYIALTLLEEAFGQRMSVAHGTTLTGEHIPKFLAKVKEAGYDITLLLCYAEDSFRCSSIDYRNKEQKFYQSSPEDALSKGNIFPQRMGAYFQLADCLYLYWSDNLETPERLAAIFKKGLAEVVDRDAFDRFVAKYEEDRAALLMEGKEIPSWDRAVAQWFCRFN